MTDIASPPQARSRHHGALDHFVYVLRSNPVTMLAFIMLAILLTAA
ncbi:MAG: ABC transporter permease, partial [Roseibium sp.]|nr:ABC transporter permease [Roseibium sp.]